MGWSGALAQAVSLRSIDGSVNMQGQLLGYEDGVYVLGTALGDIRVPGDDMICEGDACPDLGPAVNVVLAGSGVIGDGLLPAVLSGYAAALDGTLEDELIGASQSASGQTEYLSRIVGSSDEIAYRIVQGDDASGFDALLAGAADFAMSSRPIRPSEAREFEGTAAGDMTSPEREHVLAVDGLVILVNEGNEIEEITLEDLGAIYSGQITNWSQVGGRDAPINAYSLEDGANTPRFMAQTMLGSRSARFAPSVNTIMGVAAMTDAITGDPNAIGFTTYANRNDGNVLRVLTQCGVVMDPTPFAIRAEEYIFHRRLYLYSRGDLANSEAQLLLDFTTSDAADPLIEQAGFVSLDVDRRIQDDVTARMGQNLDDFADEFELELARELMVDLLQWERLSTTFRFAPGSNELDGRGRQDLERLVDYLSEQPEGTRIVAVGFTDDQGPFDTNLRLSTTRAEFVADTITQYGGARVDHVSITARGYGELSPSGCNETSLGRTANRRVEIWISN